MKTITKLLFDDEVTASSASSEAQTLERQTVYDITCVLTGANPENKAFATGTYEVQTLTFPALAGATAGDYVVFSDQSGATWAAALDKTGADPEPTGALWVAVAAGNKVNVDISGATTAADVAAAVELAIDALTGLTAVITTNDTAADGTMLLTQTVPGPTTNPVLSNADDSGVGSILGVQTTPGVAGDISIDDDTATETTHGFLTGTKVTLTTTGVLPAGLAVLTDYYIIAVDANTVSFASSQALAAAGTALDLTDYGSGTHTITVTAALAGSVKTQKNNEPIDLDPVWVDVPSSSQNFSAAGSLTFSAADVGYRSVRLVVTTTSGTVSVRARISGKGGV